MKRPVQILFQHRTDLLIIVSCLFFLCSQVSAQTNEEERIRKWREDLKFFKERVPAYDKTFTPLIFSDHTRNNNLYYAIEKNSIDAFIKGADSLYALVPQLSDEQIMIGMSKLMALSPNAHTRLYLFRVRTVMNNVPIGIWWFEKELRITTAPKPYEDMLGAKILAINGVPLQELKTQVNELISGNAQWEMYMSLYFLRSPQVMKGLSLTNNGSSMQLSIQTLKGEKRDVDIKADFVPQDATLEVWRDLSPITIKKDSLVHLLQTTQQLPAYLKNADKNYSYQFLEGGKVVYLQYNRATDSPGFTFKQLVDNLIQEMKGKSFQKFVFDIRFNTGGSIETAEQAIHSLAAELKGKKTYLITSNATFSAGIIPGALFKRLTSAKVFGEPIADELLFLSEGGNLLLPNSKISAHYANGLLNWQFEQGFTLFPDRLLTVRFKDYLLGEDTILNAIISDK